MHWRYFSQLLASNNTHFPADQSKMLQPGKPMAVIVSSDNVASLAKGCNRKLEDDMIMTREWKRLD